MKNFLVIMLIIFMQLADNIINAQPKAVNRNDYRIHIKHANGRIEVDGLLEEQTWSEAEKVGRFQRVTPTDTGFAIAQTEVMVTYDESNFYVGIVCFDPTPGRRLVESLRRDYSMADNVQVFIDTYNDQQNGYSFGLSASGIQKDELLYDGDEFNRNWDTKWISAVQNFDDRWVAEFCIPFRSLRYFEGDSVWGINFGRLDLKTNEKSAWAPMPRQFRHCDLAYTGTLIWDKPLKKSGIGFSLIPYVSGKVTKSNDPEKDAKWDGGAGFDTKIILATSMNLDITIYPDYSQVEEDRQRTNLDRFELFFPERRQFFLENSDLFADLGSTSARPFFSRRIGLNVPVYAGARLSGKMGDKWRIGLMDIQTGREEEMPASNYAVAVLQRTVFSRSNISAFLISKEVTGDHSDTLFKSNSHNRVAGLEYNLASPDGRWKGKAFYHQSFYPGAAGDAAMVAGDLMFSTRYFRASLASTWIGADYVAEVGYIRRTGYFELSPSLICTFYPASSIVLSHGPSLSLDAIYDPGFSLTDRATVLSYNIGFQNRYQLHFDASEEFVLLDRPYDPTNTGGEKLPAGIAYTWQSAGIGITSDSRKLLTVSADAGYGSYYNGTRWNLSGSLAYRFQPYGSISVSANYNNISLPEPYNSAGLVLIGPRLDATFTDKLFLTTFVQYNNQIDNLNTNVRLQWRFAPVSDLFIVYTGNSYTEDFTNKNRGLMIKLSYWFN